MYIFSQPVFQSGGNTSDGTLMIIQDGSLKTSEPKIRQYFERHNMSDVEFSDLRAFCEYLETKFFKDGRTVFYEEDLTSYTLKVYCTSPCKGFEKEIFIVGTFLKI